MSDMRPIRSLPSRVCIVCFGLEAVNLHKQPWHSVVGIAQGLSAHGFTVTFISDSRQPPLLEVAFRIITLPALYHRNTPSPELHHCLRQLNPERVIAVAGAQELLKVGRFAFGMPVSLLLANQRFQLRELARLSPLGWLREWSLLKGPLVQSLIPAHLLRRGLLNSDISHLIYFSEAAQKRHASAGLPPGSVVRPRVNQQFLNQSVTADRVGTVERKLCYFGPPFEFRGVKDAIDIFVSSCKQGLQGELLLLLRVDCEYTRSRALAIRRYIATQPSSIARCIKVVDEPLDTATLEQWLKPADVFVLPFKITVSDVPLVIIEAALSGKPVLALDVPGVSEWRSAFSNLYIGTQSQLANQLPLLAAGAVEKLDNPEQWTDWTLATSQLVNAINSPLDLRELLKFKMVCLVGVDGSGKTALVNSLSEQLGLAGHKHSYIWSRFRNYLSKPFLALMRLVGLNRKRVINGVRIGVHDFVGRKVISKIFLRLQFCDMLLDILFRYRPRLKIGLILGDRCPLDTLVDLAIDTGMSDEIFSDYGRRIVNALPKPSLMVLVQRDSQMSRRDRPDIASDPYYTQRTELYRELARIFDLPVINNNGTLEQGLRHLCVLAGRCP